MKNRKRSGNFEGNGRSEFTDLIKQFDQLFQNARFAEALDLAIKISKMTKNIFGIDSIEYGTALNKLGTSYNTVGNYAKAEQYYQQALDIQRKVLGENHPNYAMILREMGSLYMEKYDYAKAEQYYQQALDIQRKVLGENNREYAQSLNGMGVMYFTMADYPKAEQYYQQALDIQRKVLGENNREYAQSLNGMGVLYFTIADYSKAEQYHLEALEIRRRVLGVNNPDYATSLHNVGETFHVMGDYVKAEQYHLEALEIRRRVLGVNNLDYAFSLENLANIYSQNGDYVKAEQYHLEALEIRRRVLGVNNPDYALSLNNIGVFYNNKGDYSKAEQYNQQALDIQRKVLGENHPDYAASLGNLALSFKLKGDYPKAEQYYQQALDIQRKVLGENHPVYSEVLFNLALLFVASGRIDRALTLIEKVTTIDDKMMVNIFSVGSERQRMAFLETLKSKTDCLISVILQKGADLPNASTLAANLIIRRKAMGEEALIEQINEIQGTKDLSLKRKILDLNILRQQISNIAMKDPQLAYSEDNPSSHNLLKELNDKKEDLETELAHRISELNVEQKLKVPNIKEIANALPAGSALLEFFIYHRIDFESVPMEWGNEQPLARYVGFILPSGDEDKLQLIDIGETYLIDHLINAQRTSLSHALGDYSDRHLLPIAEPTEPNSSNTDYGSILRETIFDPLLVGFAGCKRLFIAPDGDLAKLPFEILTLESGSYLIDDFHISYLTTGRGLFWSKEIGNRSSNDPLVIADPDFDLSATGSLNSKNSESQLISEQSPDLGGSNIYFPSLKGTKDEGIEIANLLKVEPVMGDKALESYVKSYRSPSILHIATHGFFFPNQPRDAYKDFWNPEAIVTKDKAKVAARFSIQNLKDPMQRSGLALAGANTRAKGGTLNEDAEDGILNAEDVTTMDLSGTELVVLSACETGLGDIQIGEGVLGLRRAFMLAGAQTLVMSLWRVSDERTKELMVNFYERLLSGKPRSEALREAQLETKKKYSDPYYWGAFICQGNTDSLSITIG